jgi:hypothetical protein
MARVETVTCDVCGKVKTEVNNWFVMSVKNGNGPLLAIWRHSINDPSLDLCGEECVLKKVSELIGTKT